MYRAVIAATAATLATANINADFMQGFQTGVFVSDFDGFEDYSCPLPEMSENVERYM